MTSRGFWQGAIAATVAAVLVVLCKQPLGNVLDDLYGHGKDMVKQVVSRDALRVTQVDSNTTVFQAEDMLGTEPGHPDFRDHVLDGYRTAGGVRGGPDR